MDGKPRFEQHQIQFKVQIPSNLPPIWADSTQLWRVFENLIENAIKYNAPGVSLTIQVRRLQTQDSQPPMVRFDVIDNGQGLSQIGADHLFELYRRHNVNGVTPGYGLGLYICRQILIAHGGSIHLEADSEGAHFWFKLPLAEFFLASS